MSAEIFRIETFQAARDLAQRTGTTPRKVAAQVRDEVRAGREGQTVIGKLRAIERAMRAPHSPFDGGHAA